MEYLYLGNQPVVLGGFSNGGGSSGASTLYGHGSPMGVLVPQATDQLYIDQDQLNYWLSTGPVNTNWSQLNMSGSYLIFGPATDTLYEVVFDEMNIDGYQTKISLPTIKHVGAGGVNMTGKRIKEFSMRELIDSPSFIFNGNGLLTTIDVPKFESSSMNFDVRLNYGLSTLNMGSLRVIGGDFDISNTSLANVDTSTFQTIGGGLWFNECEYLLNINAPILTSIGNEVHGYHCTLLNTVNLSSLATIGHPHVQPSLDLHSNPALTNINLGSLTRIGGDFDFHSCGNLTTVSLNSLQQVTGSITGNDCAKLVSLNTPSLVSVSGSIYFSECYLMQSASFDSLTTVAGDLNFYRCFVLADVKMPNVIFTNAGGPRNINLSVGALNQASVDNVLARCVASGLISASIAVGGYNNSAPSTAGLIDVATLQNVYGCTVTHK